MPHVVIIGNSGAARECYWLLDDMKRSAPGLRTYYTFRGYLSWQGYEGNLKSHATYLLGDAESYQPKPDDLFVIGIGQPSLRKVVYEYFKQRGGNFLTLVHPWSDINPTAQLGEANIFQRGSIVHCDTVIGNANYLNGSVSLAHDVCVGDYNFLGPFSQLLGGCHIGSCNMLATHAAVLPKARIGDNNMIAPGGIIYKGCKDNCRMAGNPAICIGHLE